MKKIIVSVLFFCGVQDCFASVGTLMRQLREEGAQNTQSAFFGGGPNQGAAPVEQGLVTRPGARADVYRQAPKTDLDTLIADINKDFLWLVKNQEGYLGLRVSAYPFRDGVCCLKRNFAELKLKWARGERSTAIDCLALVASIKDIENKLCYCERIHGIVQSVATSEQSEKTRKAELEMLVGAMDDNESFRLIMQLIKAFKEENQE